MRVVRLVAERFRNLEPVDLPIEARFVVLHGTNAQGKTNALEIVHLLATLKPLRGRKVRELVRFGERTASVAARIEHQGIERWHRVDLEPQSRKVSLDGKAVYELGEYFASIRAIAFTPSDAEIVTGEPGRRRNWLDRAVFTANPAHLDRVRGVRRVLDQKAAVLRQSQPDRAMLDVLDEQLAHLGAELVDRRIRMLAELQPHLRDLHATLVGEGAGPEELLLDVQTHARGETVDERRAALTERLAAVRSREIERHATLAGPQLDDVRIAIDGRPARDFASRGQVRSVVLALKLAEMEAARVRGDVPLFLIDDVSSELDAFRTSRLVGTLADLGAQVFATTTDPSALCASLPPSATLLVQVRGGVLLPP
jgi:DNA replication and repair protein RecF